MTVTLTINKDRIDRLVDIYIDAALSVSNDAGWEGDSTLGRLVDFRGFIPPPSGNDQSNLSMIHAIRLLRGRHAEFPRIHSALMEIKQEYALAILARRRYNGLVPGSDPVRAYQDHDRARLAGMDVATYRYNLGKAYYAIQRELNRLEQYERNIVAFACGV